MRLAWVDQLAERLKTREVVILHGNIHDRFPTADGAKSLDHVLNDLCDEAHVDFRSLDADGGDEYISKVRNDAAKPGVTLIRELPGVFPRADRWEEPQSWQRHALFLEMLRGLSAKRKQSGQPALAEQRRLVLAFQNEATVPAPFLAGVPGVVRLHVPLPQLEERLEWANANLERSTLTADELTEARRRFQGLTDGLFWYDLEAIARDFKHRADGDMAACIKDYRFGKVEDKWKSASQRLVGAAQKITAGLEPLLGQDAAVERAIGILAKACLPAELMMSAGYDRPRGIMFFVGPTGVGKTMLAKKLAALIFGDEKNYIGLDMSEYSSKEDANRLVGAPPGYVGYSEGGQLTTAVRQKPFSVVLFDEIDKADGEIMKKFLQILDEGRLTDGKGQVCYFSETLIVFTSNACATEVEDELAKLPEGAGDDEWLVAQYQTRLRSQGVFAKHPEILNRIGLSNIIPFKSIKDKELIRNDVRSRLDRLTSNFESKSIFIYVEDKEEMISYIVNKSDSDRYGLRNIRNFFEAILVEPIARAMLDRGGSNIDVKIVNGNLQATRS